MFHRSCNSPQNLSCNNHCGSVFVFFEFQSLFSLILMDLLPQSSELLFASDRGTCQSILCDYWNFGKTASIRHQEVSFEYLQDLWEKSWMTFKHLDYQIPLSLISSSNTNRHMIYMFYLQIDALLYFHVTTEWKFKSRKTVNGESTSKTWV